ncbi:Pyrrolopyrazine biosynthesis cluster F-like protein [Cladobotryum mycophilum]|uniref:Pyrrolopyrazine biosynthesis cluster F-like protein n=1 Tax=Cladobotryum mycophilum TaxID=491253 RepID=A0ABR0SWG4_9HYPO
MDPIRFARQNFSWGPFTEISEENRQGYDNLLQAGLEKLENARAIAIAEEKPLFVKNHIFHLWEPSSLSQSMWGGECTQPFTCNPRSSTSPTRTNLTIFPDDYLASWLPVFMIRHPALTFESWYRAETCAGSVDVLGKSWSFFPTFRWSRQLHDLYLSREQEDPTGGYSKPIVVDADDIIERWSIDKLCEMCHMDPAHVRYEWGAKLPADDPKSSQRQKIFMNGLWSSTSIA